MNTSNFTLLLLFFSSTLIGQSILGVVTDSKNDPIFFATVALYQVQDSSLVKAESTDENGRFLIDKIDQGQYYINASMLGYADGIYEGITMPDDKNTEITIQLGDDANLLETIEIKDKRPLLEQKADKLIVNVEGNITNTSGNLLDVMKKVPGMLVIRDRLSMVGSGSPTILLNGKTTQYMDVQSLLRDMPGDNISKVEIIHQPGAEYEAAGSGPIINIILKKNSLFGTNGSVSVGVGKGTLWDYNTGLNLSHYAGSFNITGGLGYSKNAWIEDMDITRRLSNIGNDIDGSYTQNNYEEATPDTYRGNIRMDWDVNQKHSLGLESKYYNNDNEYTGNNTTQVDLFRSEASDYMLTSVNEHDRSWTYFSVNPYYKFEIDTSGQKLELDFNYAKYDVNADNVLTTTNPSAPTFVQSYDQPGKTNIYATALDYTLPVSDNIELKLGAKYSFADLDNDLVSLFKIGEGPFINDEKQSNHYLFEEEIKAGYSKVNWNSGPWSGTAGLRYEDSEALGNSLTLGDTLTYNIKKLFPSASLAREIVGPLKATLSYSKRINRPRYSNLNPFVYYIDPFTSSRGNANLRPELTDSGKFTLSFEGQPFFNIEYQNSSDAIVELTEQDPNSEEAFKIDRNLQNRTRFAISLFFPLEFVDGLSGYGGTIVSKTSYESEYLNDIFDQGRWNSTFFLQAEFALPADFQAELGGWYTTASQEGIFQAEYLYGTSFGLSKKFLDNKLKVNFGVEDFLNRFWHARVDYQQDMDIIVRWQAPTASLKVSYKFGNQHLKSKANRKGSASEEINRASQG